MSFKLLAIRPLTNTNTSFLKNLEENCIYRFYSEYDYQFTEKQTKKSVIEFQEIFFKTKRDQNNEKLKKFNITSIHLSTKIPTNFYAKNINISAIVGKNGSGKSSLLELLYAFIFNISKKEGILKFETEKVNFNDINLEIYYLYNNEYYKIVNETVTTGIKITVFKSNGDGDKFKQIPNGNEVLFKFYSLVINYSIYGLNSKASGGWIKKLFHKNDGYQSPIVINPFRNDGNIDVNNEYNLAQARLILNHFVIKDDNLIQGIDLDQVKYYLNIHKTQIIADDRREDTKEKLIIDDIITFLDLNNFGGVSKISSFFQILFKGKSNSSIKLLEEFFKNKPKTFLLSELSKDYEVEISYLCLLYIFKKLKRISYNYEEYQKYHFLFDFTWNYDFSKKDILKFKKDFRKSLKILGSEEIFTIDKFYLPLVDFFDSFIKKHPILSLLISDTKQKIREVTENVAYNLSIGNVIDLIFEKLSEIIDLSRITLFSNYIDDLNTDDTHIAFKFKQAVNYFNNQIFSSLKVGSVVDENNQAIPYLYDIDINQDFLNTDIYNIPISFFEPEIMMNKNGKKYPFNRLSSGEQQMIHSILNITYHLYNIKSVKKGRKRKYEHINIIFDEVELYFHPEYQRVFIANLIQKLDISDFKNFSFNIIFSTHSPFILSDIPSQNILKLDEGLPITDGDNVNSFAANIYDLLKDEFFLKDGAIGAFANKKISEVLSKKILEQGDLDIVNLVGDPFLKGVIKKKIEDKLSNSLLSKEIMRLQKILNNRS
ncbi:MAG: hypothetical protein K0R36_421 [Chryseobacterium sp.]|nr:hypothetical protein [Chryseobacterium sp.]